MRITVHPSAADGIRATIDADAAEEAWSVLVHDDGGLGLFQHVDGECRYISLPAEVGLAIARTWAGGSR